MLQEVLLIPKLSMKILSNKAKWLYYAQHIEYSVFHELIDGYGNFKLPLSRNGLWLWLYDPCPNNLLTEAHVSKPKSRLS